MSARVLPPHGAGCPGCGLYLSMRDAAERKAATAHRDECERYRAFMAERAGFVPIDSAEARAIMARGDVTGPLDGVAYRAVAAAPGGRRDPKVTAYGIARDGQTALVAFRTGDPVRGVAAGRVETVSTFILL